MLLQSKDNPIEIGKMGANTNTTNLIIVTLYNATVAEQHLVRCIHCTYTDKPNLGRPLTDGVLCLAFV